MKRKILAMMFSLSFTSFISLSAQWAVTYGGGRLDEARSIQQTSDGGYIVAGYTHSFGTEKDGDVSWDIWILKLSPDGEIEWQKRYGGSSSDYASSIQQTDDGGYIVAGSTSSFGEGYDYNIWILKLSSDGDIEWQKRYGGSNSDYASSIQQTNGGEYIVAGYTESLATGTSDIWILKLSSAGDVEWQKTYGGSEKEESYSIQQTDDGRYIVAGVTNSFGGWGDIWVLNLSPDGEIEWQRTYGTSNTDSASSIQQTDDGGYIVAGSAYSGGGGRYFWVLKLLQNGNIDWQRLYGGIGGDETSSIQQTNDGGYIVVGSTSSFSDENIDIWILKLSSGGGIEWQKTYGGNYSWDEARSIKQTNDGGYIVGGNTESWGSGEEDIWILKLSSTGSINPLCAFVRSSSAEVSDTDISPENTDTTPQDTDIIPQETDITPKDSNANVYKLCVSDICTLILSSSSGGTTDPAPGTYTYETGTEVTLKATPSGEYHFNRWSGNAETDANPITITMDGDKSIRASFFIYYGGSGEFEWGGGCFIATAAYGSPLHPYVKTLRDFRDTYLLPNKFGRSLVKLYYKYSPFVSNLITKYKVLKVAARFSLLPVIAFSYSMVHFDPIITAVMFVFIFMLPIFLILFFRRRLMRIEAKDPKALASLD